MSENELLFIILIAILFAWCFGLSFYLHRAQMRAGRMLLRIARLEAQQAPSEGMK